MSGDQVDSVNFPTLDPDEPCTELYECPCGEPASTMGNRSWVQRPQFPGGLADISSCVSPRPSCHQVVPLYALKEWSLWSSDTQFAPFGVDPSPQAALSSCLWWLITPTYGLNVARVATRIRTSLQHYLVSSEESLRLFGLRFRNFVGFVVELSGPLSVEDTLLC